MIIGQYDISSEDEKYLATGDSSKNPLNPPNIRRHTSSNGRLEFPSRHRWLSEKSLHLAISRVTPDVWGRNLWSWRKQHLTKCCSYRLSLWRLRDQAKRPGYQSSHWQLVALASWPWRVDAQQANMLRRIEEALCNQNKTVPLFGPTRKRPPSGLRSNQMSSAVIFDGIVTGPRARPRHLLPVFNIWTWKTGWKRNLMGESRIIWKSLTRVFVIVVDSKIFFVGSDFYGTEVDSHLELRHKLVGWRISA